MPENMGRRLVEPYFGKCILFTLAGTVNKGNRELPPSVQNKALAQPLYCTTVLRNDKTAGTLLRTTDAHNVSTS